MKISMITAALLMTASLTAQLPPLPAQSYYEVGKTDWTTVCGSYGAHTSMTSQPWNRTVDPSYPGTIPRYSVNVGGTFYCRAEQHAVCPGWYGPGGLGLAPYFYFGPRTGSVNSVNLSLGFQPGQNTLFNYSTQAILYNAQFQGPNEFNGAIQTWACQITIPNNPALVGQEWAVQAMSISVITLNFHLGDSHYTKII